MRRSHWYYLLKFITMILLFVLGTVGLILELLSGAYDIIATFTPLPQLDRGSEPLLYLLVYVICIGVGMLLLECTKPPSEES